MIGVHVKHIEAKFGNFSFNGSVPPNSRMGQFCLFLVRTLQDGIYFWAVWFLLFRREHAMWAPFLSDFLQGCTFL